MRTTNRIATLIIGFLLIASAGMEMAHTARAAAEPTNAGPTKENAPAVERELGRAMRTIDPAFFHLLASCRERRLCHFAVCRGTGEVPLAGQRSQEFETPKEHGVSISIEITYFTAIV
jgi:hypothetical protein